MDVITYPFFCQDPPDVDKAYIVIHTDNLVTVVFHLRFHQAQDFLDPIG